MAKYFENINTLDEAKELYLELAKKLHPDKPGGSSDEFREMQEEYKEVCIAIRWKPVLNVGKGGRLRVKREYREEIINSAGSIASSGAKAIIEGLLDKFFD